MVFAIQGCLILSALSLLLAALASVWQKRPTVSAAEVERAWAMATQVFDQATQPPLPGRYP